MQLGQALGAFFRRKKRGETVEQLREKLGVFRNLVEQNDRVLELIADAGEKLGGEYVFDRKYLDDLIAGLRTSVHAVVGDLNGLTQNRFPELYESLARIDAGIEGALDCRMVVPDTPYLIPVAELGVEHADAAGEKMARLGELRSRLDCRIPDGFVITTRACRDFLEDAGLVQAVESLREHVVAGDAGVDEEARQLRERVLGASLPRKLERLLRREASRLVRWDEDALLAVRSSAAGEDGEMSFAGQYETVLGVRAGDVPAAWRRVVASLFARGVIEHHRHHGVPPSCGLMAVGCLRMVEARSSGVVYSLDPLRPSRNVQRVSAAWGLGTIVVEGEAAVDRFEVLREPGFPVSSTEIASKPWRYVAGPDGGPVREDVPEADRERPSLTPEEVSTLAAIACRIERYMKAAQDVEWAIDGDGELFILQARPLGIAAENAAVDIDLSDVVSEYPVLLRDAGEVACRGIGTGTVFVLGDQEGALDVLPPPGSVIVARAATPRLGGILAGASAVISDVGSATGHFAAVARDFRVPTIVATEVATRVLRAGMEVTVDAEENVVYAGRIDALLRFQLLKRSSFEDAPEFRMLRRLLRRIAPLRLRDPQAPGFVAAQCRTYHDVIRFAHEKAIAEMTEIGALRPARGGRWVRRLELPIPLDLVLIDLGDGLRDSEGSANATLEDVRSRPLRALLDELATGTAWETKPADMDLHGFMSSATRSINLVGPSLARPAQNLAIVSSEYLHLSLRLGYHFNIVDAFVGDTAADNYIYFRFAGGVTELTRRSRRAALLRRILEGHGFVAEGRGDLVIGRIKGQPAGVMLERLGMLGRLIGFTRQLDIHLKNDDLVDRYVGQFMNGSTARPDAGNGTGQQGRQT